MSDFIKRLSLTGWAALIGIAAFAFSVQLPAAQTSESTSPVSRTNHVVYIEDLQFTPSNLQVKIGDQITWINRDFIPHTATAMDKSWDSANLAKDEAFSLIVDENTLLQYFCIYHPNMVAQIEIMPSE